MKIKKLTYLTYCNFFQHWDGTFGFLYARQSIYPPPTALKIFCLSVFQTGSHRSSLCRLGWPQTPRFTCLRLPAQCQDKRCVYHHARHSVKTWRGLQWTRHLSKTVFTLGFFVTVSFNVNGIIALFRDSEAFWVQHHRGQEHGVRQSQAPLCKDTYTLLCQAVLSSPAFSELRKERQG